VEVVLEVVDMEVQEEMEDMIQSTHRVSYKYFINFFQHFISIGKGGSAYGNETGDTIEGNNS
jgi:hypothetical protein